MHSIELLRVVREKMTKDLEFINGLRQVCQMEVIDSAKYRKAGLANGDLPVDIQCLTDEVGFLLKRVSHAVNLEFDTKVRTGRAHGA